MYLPLFIAKRYTLENKKNNFISFISLISVIGISLGVAVLIIVLSVMNGFGNELKQRILGAIPHGSLYADENLTHWQDTIASIQNHNQVTATAPFVSLQGMLSTSFGLQGVLVNGVDPKYEKDFSIVEEHMLSGSLDSLQAGEFSIVLGDILANQLYVGIGDKVTLILPKTTTSIIGVVPRVRVFTVTGIFSLGAELDANLSYINIRDAAKLAKIGDSIHGINIKFADLFAAPELVHAIALDTPNITHTSNWTYSQGNLFQSIAMERRMVSLLLFLIIAVAAFNIVSNLVMMVTEKKSDIAILRTMGMKPASVMAIFIYHGSIVGIVGTIIGTIFGITGALTVDKIVATIEKMLDIQFLSADTYFISYLPSDLRLENVIMVASVSLFISLVVTIYPAYKASKINPADVLKND